MSTTLTDDAQALLVALYAPVAILRTSITPDDIPKHVPMMAWVKQHESSQTVDPMFGYFCQAEHDPSETVFVAVHPGQKAGIELSLSWVFKYTALPMMHDFLRAGMIA